MNSGVIVALTVSGIFLLGASLVRHFVIPNPLINFKFLARRNTLLLSVVLIFFRFVMLATVVGIPSYLASIQGYRPLQTRSCLVVGCLAAMRARAARHLPVEVHRCPAHPDCRLRAGGHWLPHECPSFVGLVG